MIKRIYIFIFFGTLIENSWHLFSYFGASDDFVYYTVFPTCQRLEILLLPLWWIVSRLRSMPPKEHQTTWIYLIAVTYFIFQLVDAIDMATNSNIRSPLIDFVIFISLNLAYWINFRKK